MKIKQKFVALSGIVGIILLIMSVIGYYTAYNSLVDSVDAEINATVETNSHMLDGWLSSKGAIANAEADLMTELEAAGIRPSNEEMRHYLSLAASDSDVGGITRCDENGMFLPYKGKDRTGETDPHSRAWYNDARNVNKTLFTDAYVGKTTGKLVISSVTPFYTADKKFYGAICVDINLDTLGERAKNIKYRGEGKGYIIEKSGKLLATDGDGEQMSEAKDIPGIGSHIDEMFSKGQGFFTYDSSDGEMVFAYTTLESADWIVGISVPYDFVFASLIELRMYYAALTIIGVILIVIMCLAFARRIVAPIVALEAQTAQIAEGNLHLEPLVVDTDDEIGSMSTSFNKMHQSLKNLIGKMASISEQVAASSEELTANAQQSAQASVHVAETVGKVSDGMNQQLKDIDGAKKNVDIVFDDINSMTEKTKHVAGAAVDMQTAAMHGEDLMKVATDKMSNIEKSVMESADVVKTLGENSKEIGQIVDAISAIADQTNLLALNAAIEAARAGEHGRGFAVVADEVRKLAAESQTSAEKIKERILGIQKDTERAVVSMQQGTSDVQAGTKAINEVGTQFDAIMGRVTDMTNQMNDITEAVNSVSSGAGNIVTAVDSIDSVSRTTADHTQTISASTEEQSASNEEIAAASQSLANLASDMQAEINKFKL